MHIILDTTSSAPLYRQIAAAIERAVRDGQLLPGDRLPPVRALAAELKAAHGTIKRAYDELCRRGVLEMKQGRGTFIAAAEPLDSRKERAMAAIDGLLDCLEELDFSQREIQIFLDLKLRARAHHSGRLRLALVDDSPEGLRMLAEQLYGPEDIEVYELPLRDALAYPYRLTDDMDLVVTTAAHFERLRPLVPDEGRLCRLCVRAGTRALASLARLPEGTCAAVLALSRPFAAFAAACCRAVGVALPDEGWRLLGAPGELDAYLRGCTAAVLPSGWEQLCTREEQEALAAFARVHPLIPLTLEPDEGSRLALGERLRALLSPAEGTR